MRYIVLSLALLFSASCAGVSTPIWITGHGAADLEPAESFTDSRVAATLLAERRARDEVTAQVIAQQTAEGITVEEMAVKDPEYRSRVFDVVRNSKMEAKEFDDAGGVIVTVTLDPAEVESQLGVPQYTPVDHSVVKTDRVDQSDN